MINKTTTKFVITGLLVGLLYFFSRLQNLVSLPVFGDEAIYVRWSQVMKSVETLRFLPLTDGKQPLFMWLTIPFFKIFSDPLFASRFVSVLAGFGNLLGIASCVYFLTKGNLKTVFISSLLYLSIPFTFFFDRMALADNLLNLFGIWSLFLSLLLSKFPRLDISLILGFVLGMAWITKSPALFFVILSFVTFLILNPNRLPKIIYPIISSFISFGIYNLLRLGPQFHMIALRNRDYIWPLSELIKHPFDPFKPHFLDVITLYSQYLSIPLIALFLLLLIKSFKDNHKISFNSYILILLLWLIVPLFTNITISKVLTARYILYTIPPLIILFSLVLANIRILVLIIFLIPNIIWLIKMSSDPFHFKLPPTEAGYLTDWTSGWGIKPAADFLINQSKTANVIVGTEGAFGSLPDGLQIYTEGKKNLTIIGTGLGYNFIPNQLIDAKNHGDDVYLLINQSRVSLTNTEIAKLKLVKSFDKPDGDKLLLYRL